jgi:hypothetical protein
MSARNGDRSRHHRLRKKNVARRERMRALVAAAKLKSAPKQ